MSASRAPETEEDVRHEIELKTAGRDAGVRSLRGRRKEMEDAVAVAHNFTCFAAPGHFHHQHCRSDGTNSLHFFGVYDGHGGAQAANYCRQRLHHALAEEIARTTCPVNASWWWERAMESCFLRVEEEIGSAVDMGGCDTVGCTAVVAVVGCCHVVVANCGDSRAVLSRAGLAVPLSQDHKPDREDELARIEAAGGKVFKWDGYRVMGMLAMSRAIGDQFLKPFVIANPEVTFTQRSPADECLILASDGLWDVMSNEDACAIARNCLSTAAGAAPATSQATSKTLEPNASYNSRGSCSGHAANKRRGERPAGGAAHRAASVLARAALDKGSADNISIVVVDLRV